MQRGSHFFVFGVELAASLHKQQAHLHIGFSGSNMEGRPLEGISKVRLHHQVLGRRFTVSVQTELYEGGVSTLDQPVEILGLGQTLRDCGAHVRRETCSAY